MEEEDETKMQRKRKSRIKRGMGEEEKREKE
jgi:hypothetical protein